MLDGSQQFLDQPFLVAVTDIVRGRRIHPLGLDPRAAQHAVDAPTPRIGDDQHGRALLASAPGAARTVLERLGVAPALDVDAEAKARTVYAAPGEAGADAQ